RDVLLEKDKYPVDLTEPDIEIHTAPATRGHMLNFLEAIDKGGRPVADIEQGYISTSSCIIANMSMKLGRPLVYDPVKKIIINDPEATRLLQRPYRGPWIHP
ncbi:MAG: gfo/Idh/MocA family oxidoreductase, partial [Chitinophagaceae bacterium]